MISLYNASIPMMIKYLGNLKVILTKAEQHCVDKDLNPEEMIKFRLIEDMRSLDYQVQSISNTAKFLATRLALHHDTYFPDTETTFPQLQSRVDATISILSEIDPSSMENKEDAEILMETKSFGTYRFTGYSYVVQYACPNFHFHLGSAYCILRHLGVPLTAFDYLDTQHDLFVNIETPATPVTPVP
ncbi:helix-turn-helix domain-containing protein [Colletotrichum tofieldiae]|uniref:Helix-turn-helix domain-containing protein n=1 Tax=Colletotrichum tofieldiae TaxID=708197 RepID=A0A166PJX3_9PEZI|nr:helix-turn-helix domain-containing protein [Colletotrichum tofieldiae]GKT56770.1 helix-turn-helix domain-containing protein [Colletotrichum tofieldiae]GKT76267.1 helix-turn-helix domain-containing protein [Colletotrichum tofieldiae]GKT87315.1 helix-turn-helix domain-containing protein [Colletotrichum tofieldiae]